MKKLTLFFALIFIVLATFSQQNSASVQTLNCKRGIYLSFEEVINNSPSFTDSFEIKERTKGNIIMVGGGKFGFELSSGNKSEYKKLKKNLIGISDGINFYISDKYTIGGWQGLTICLLSGPYIIASVQGTAGQYTGGGLIPSMVKVGNGYLIDLKTGKSVAITNKVLKDLLKPYPEIAKKYSVTDGLTENTFQIVSDVDSTLKTK